jgi:hypothetical protein
MTGAFLTGALASAVAGAGLVALLLWVITVVTGSTAAWSLAPWLVVGVALLFAIGTFVAERFAYRRSLARMRAIGEPWAYRER